MNDTVLLQEFAKFHKEFGATHQQFSQLNARFDQIDNRFTQVDTAIAEVKSWADHRFEKITNELVITEKHLKAIHSSIRVLEDDVTDVKHTVNEHSRILRNWDSQEEEFRSKVMNHVDFVFSKYKEFVEGQTSLNRRVATLEKRQPLGMINDGE